MTSNVLRGRFAEVRGEIDWYESYLGRKVAFSTGTTDSTSMKRR